MERTTLKRVFLTAMVALLVATAGCSGLLGGDSGNGDGNGNGNAGTGYGVAGSELDGQTLTDATADTVESAGSYTVTTDASFTTTRQGQESTSTSATTLSVDFDNDRGLRNQSQSLSAGEQTQEQSTVVYTNGSTSYRKQTTGGETTYDRQEGEGDSLGAIRPVNTTHFTQNYTQIVDGFNWEKAGSSDVDGVAVTEYDLTGIEDEEALNIGENTTVDSTSGSLFVDGDGAVRKVTISYALSTDEASTSIEVTTELSDVGSTTVSEPDWLSQV